MDRKMKTWTALVVLVVACACVGCGNGNPPIPARELQMEPLHHGGDSIVKTTHPDNAKAPNAPTGNGATLDLGARKNKK
jgi:hypothetical protein